MVVAEEAAEGPDLLAAEAGRVPDPDVVPDQGLGPGLAAGATPEAVLTGQAGRNQGEDTRRASRLHIPNLDPGQSLRKSLSHDQGPDRMANNSPDLLRKIKLCPKIGRIQGLSAKAEASRGVVRQPKICLQRSMMIRLLHNKAFFVFLHFLSQIL